MEPQLYWHKYQKRPWWVAKEVANPPEELTSCKRKPVIAAVTYFSEPEDILIVTNPSKIVKYNVDKESYIRKGLQYFKEIKSTFCEQWKDDVRKAEEFINGDLEIIERIENEEQQPQLYWHKYKTSLWWVAKEVANPPEELKSRKRKPIIAIAAVNYLSEPETIVVETNASEIVKYNVDKDSFIRKGLLYFRKNKLSGLQQQWMRDVRKAEELINGDVNIIERIENEDNQNVRQKFKKLP